MKAFKFREGKNRESDSLVNISDLRLAGLDRDKVKYSGKDLIYGIENYIRFQKFSSFRWPVWVQNQNIDNRSFNHLNLITPLYLCNNRVRQWTAFTTFISDEELCIDPSGAISISYDNWSLEFWILKGGQLYRAQENIDDVSVRSDLSTSNIEVNLENKLFNLKQKIYGAKSTVDEAVVEVLLSLKGQAKDAYLILAVRPYNQLVIGSIGSIDYSKSGKLVSINGRRSLALSGDPVFVLTGNGESGDVDLKSIEKNSYNVRCSQYMSTMLFGYNITKGKNIFHFRVMLSGKGNLSSLKMNFKELEKEYHEYSKIRINSGMNIKIPDDKLISWFYCSKLSTLNYIKKELSLNTAYIAKWREISYIIAGYNRMGYFNESKGLIADLIGKYTVKEQEADFNFAIVYCYFIVSFADYFLHTRDLDYLQLNYNSLFKTIAEKILKYSEKIKNINSLKENSLDFFYQDRAHFHDIILLSFALDQCSYMARCLGIFGDEAAFAGESERLQNMYAAYLSGYEKKSITDDFFYMDMVSGFPYRLNISKSDRLKIVIDKIIDYFNGTELFNRSLGIDIISNLILANNLLALKDRRALGVIDDLSKFGGESCTLPEFVNPSTGYGCWGEGCSKSASALFFIFIRNMLFIDTKDRLDIFPIPVEDWFKSGREIIVKDAPSRFGKINFKMKATTNEIQFHFDELPKYIPPDIMITLPFKAQLLEGEDFILKKSVNNSHVINGWPSLVRFIRKKK